MTRLRRMTRLMGLAALAMAAALLAPGLAAQEPEAPSAPSEVLQLRVENSALKAEILELRQVLAQLEAQEVLRERAQIEADLAQQAAGWRVDWQTGRLVPREAEPDDDER